MGQVADIILPVFGLLGLGYGLAWMGYLGRSVGEGLETYVYRVAVPIVIFQMITGASAPETAAVPLLASYFGAVAVVWLLALWLSARWLRISDARAASIATGSSYSNSVLLGLPLIVQTYGEPGAIIFFILFPFQLPIFAIAQAVYVELAGGRDLKLGRLARSTLWNLVTNPILISIVVGVLWRQSSLQLPIAASAIVSSVAATALPCALFTMGMTLRRYDIASGARAAVLMAVLKLAALPAIVWLFAGPVAGLDPVAVGVLTLFAAAPAGVNTYILAVRSGAGTAEASSGIALSTALSIFSISAVLVLLGLG